MSAIYDLKRENAPLVRTRQLYLRAKKDSAISVNNKTLHLRQKLAMDYPNKQVTYLVLITLCIWRISPMTS